MTNVSLHETAAAGHAVPLSAGWIHKYLSTRTKKIYYGNRQQKSSICCESSTILCEESRMSDPLTHFFNRRSDVTTGRSPERSKHSLPSILPDFLLPVSFLALICPTAPIVWIHFLCFICTVYIMRLLSVRSLHNTFLSDIAFFNSIGLLFVCQSWWIWTNWKEKPNV